jgi:hypothetical protein
MSRMSSIIQELLIVSSNTKRRHGSRNCSSMRSTILKELLMVSSIILKDGMESQLLINEQYKERTANCEKYNTNELAWKPQLRF